MWQILFANLAQISIVLLGWQVVADRVGDMRSRKGRFVMGCVLGGVACVSIAIATPIMPGFRFDLRGPMVACAAFFGGWIAAGPAVVLTVSVRLLLGGGGTAPGVLAILAIAAAALALRTVTGRRVPNPLGMASLAAAAALANNAGYLLVPADKFAAILKVSFAPSLFLIFATTWILACLLKREMDRWDLVRINDIYRQMVDALPDCMNAKDLKGRFIAANPATAALMGAASPSDLIGQTDANFYDCERSDDFARLERRVSETGEVQTVEQEIHVAGRDPSWVSTQKIPLVARDGTLQGVITHNRDITAQRRAVRMKSEFVSTVSHELRTPLTSVRGSLVMMEAACGEALPANGRKLLEIARRNSERLVRLINDILDVEKIENGGLTFDIGPHRLSSLVEAAMPGFSNFMPEQRVTVEFDDRAPDAVARVDPARLEQILANLVSNAIKFSKVGGIVTIGLRRADGRIVLSVRDRGIGIPKEFRERIFDRFEQADASDARLRGGAGLGLHIAKVMAGRMDGDVRFTSEEGRGTTFLLDMPDHTGAAVPEPRCDEKEPVSGAAPTLDRKRVLYVEDDESLGKMVAALVGDGLAVTHVPTLAAARAEMRRGAYDLYILDDELPDGSGLGLLEAIDAEMPVIVLTAKEIRGCLPENVRDRFVKTRVSEAALATRIRTLLAERRSSLPEAV